MLSNIPLLTWQHHIFGIAEQYRSLYAAVPPFVACSLRSVSKLSLPNTITVLLQMCLESLDQLPCQEQRQHTPLMCTKLSL